eukprot:TRINITY_DN23754_c0_g1_i21.p2 TRINITY_DN23754_c0_g1~~TRINITY_DN23754_c0_g1_i21.p2  ORF type:complete len:213 (+),score=39.54 TRINITY_DN23754_c0_g1_i21:56-694(+)
MGCCESMLFDPPVRRCCGCGDNCCIRRCDRATGIPVRDYTPPYEDIQEADGASCRIHELETDDGVPFHVWCYEPRSRGKGMTLSVVYSHGRHEDITFIAIRRFLKFISVHVRSLRAVPAEAGPQGKTNVYLYEYPGFAHSGGEPSVSQTIMAATKTFDYVAALNRQSVMLMGHSMGCHFAIQTAVQRAESPYLAGVAIRSPFTSICAVKTCP